MNRSTQQAKSIQRCHLQKPSFLHSILWTLLLGALPLSTYTQDISDAFKNMDIAYGAPEATEMAKYGNLDVSLYKGVPNVGVPIHSFELESLSLPVSLQYNNGGITVDQVATNVGLGWTLHAGGQITQSAHGDNDFDMALDSRLFNGALQGFDPNRYGGLADPDQTGFSDYIHVFNDNTNRMTVHNFKPDVYYYSYGGHNGKFLINGTFGNGPLHAVPYTNHKIDHVSNPSANQGQFEITDQNGNKYIFDQVETSTTRQSCSGGLTGVNAFTERPTNNSYTWHLGKIITPNGDELRFTYSTLDIFTYQLPDVLQKYKFKNGDILNCTYQNLQNYDYRCYVYKDVRPKVLEKIQWVRAGVVLEEVDFNYSGSRSDFGNNDYKKLDQITLKKGGATADTWSLGHSYFTSSGGSSQAYKRLKLTSVTQSGHPAHRFEYYTTHNMPHRGSLAQSHWGFYNGKVNNQSLIPSNIVGTIGLTGLGDRGSDFVKMKAWSMTKHTYPTGGSTTFNMEGYYGGLRINNMVDSDSDGVTLRTKYYTYGTYSAPVPNYRDDYKTHYVQVNFSLRSCEYDTYSASPVPPVTTYNSFHVSGFSKVTILDEQNGSQGKTEVEFSLGTHHLNPTLGNADDVLSWGEGEKLKETVYNHNNTVVKRTENEFKVNHTNSSLWTNPTMPNENFLYAMDIRLIHGFYKIPINSTGTRHLYIPARFDIEKFRIVSAWYHPKTTIETDYDFNGQNPVVTTTNYFYENLTHALPTRTEMVGSDGNTVVTKTWYPDDVANSSSLESNPLDGPEFTAVDKLKKDDHHRIATPVQVQTTVKTSGGSTLSKTHVRTNFKMEGNIVVPKDLETLKGTYNASSNPEKKRIIYHDYYPNGNLKEISKNDGTHIVYVWGYNQRFPVAKVENATKAQVASAIGTDYHAGSGALSASKESALRNISGVQVTTYTFLPKAGVTSITDPKEYTTTYHYDSENRLQYIKDEDGNILSETKYNYQ